MSGRIKGIVLNILVPGSGFMAQGRWGWGFLYLILAFSVGIITFGLGYLALGFISAFHAGLLGDAKHELSEKDIERIATASAAAQKKMPGNEPDQK
jgi:hypothetical protein